MSKKMTIAELIALHSSEIVPAVGDKAYCHYRGRCYTGVITAYEVDEVNGRERGTIEPEDQSKDWGWHHEIRGLYFGYDEKSKYDVENRLWQVMPDAD